MGRLAKGKDFSTLIQAFAFVCEHRPARLMILGEGQERPKLEALVHRLRLEEEVSLPGFAINPYVYMAKASVFALSSLPEGFGNVLVEAMAVGTSIVSTNCKGSPKEILQNGKYGKLVPVRDAQALAQAILETLESSTKPEILQQRAKIFSTERVIEQYLDILKLSL